MLFADESASIFTYLLGMIVLVMTAVGLSLVIDRRNELSINSGGVQQEIILADTKIDALTTDYKNALIELDRSKPVVLVGSPTYRELSVASEILQKRQVHLRQTCAELCLNIASLQQDFSQARSDYRRKTRMVAIGENLGNLSIRGGQVYQQATISRVTDVGLEIRHEHGFARIQGPDLDIKLQERFQWSDEEREKSLRREQANREAQTKEPDAVLPIAPRESNRGYRSDAIPPSTEQNPNHLAVTDSQKLDLLRNKVGAWKQIVSTLKASKAEADCQISYGNSRSVPGSLETWAAKSDRLGRDLAKAQSNLRLAKTQLAEIAPGDFQPEQEQEQEK